MESDGVLEPWWRGFASLDGVQVSLALLISTSLFTAAKNYKPAAEDEEAVWLAFCVKDSRSKPWPALSSHASIFRSSSLQDSTILCPTHCFKEWLMLLLCNSHSCHELRSALFTFQQLRWPGTFQQCHLALCTGLRHTQQTPVMHHAFTTEQH